MVIFNVSLSLLQPPLQSLHRQHPRADFLDRQLRGIQVRDVVLVVHGFQGS